MFSLHETNDFGGGLPCGFTFSYFTSSSIGVSASIMSTYTRACVPSSAYKCMVLSCLSFRTLALSSDLAAHKSREGGWVVSYLFMPRMAPGERRRRRRLRNGSEHVGILTFWRGGRAPTCLATCYLGVRLCLGCVEAKRVWIGG